MKYDAIIVLGGGLSDTGDLTKKGQARVEKAIELLTNGDSSLVIFSGKWHHKRVDLPPKTEAEAMKDLAISLGISQEQILTEEESTMTGTNICKVKTEYLMPNNWHRVAVVTSELHTERTRINLAGILGPDYTYNIISSDYKYTKEEYAAMKEVEKGKVIRAKEFFKNITPGDHVTAYKKALNWASKE